MGKSLILSLSFSGYFTSRPGLKGHVRKCNSHLQACKQLEAVHNGFEDSGLSSIKLRELLFSLSGSDIHTRFLNVSVTIYKVCRKRVPNKIILISMS